MSFGNRIEYLADEPEFPLHPPGGTKCNSFSLVNTLEAPARLPTSRSRWGPGSSMAPSCCARRRWAARAAAAQNTPGGTPRWSSTYPSATCRAWPASALLFMPSWIKWRSRSPPKTPTSTSTRPSAKREKWWEAFFFPFILLVFPFHAPNAIFFCLVCDPALPHRVGQHHGVWLQRPAEDRRRHSALLVVLSW